jgi:uncharacterized repeat protein (TIGR03803 family)
MIRIAPLFSLAITTVVFVAPAEAAHLRTLYSFCVETACTDGSEPSDGLAIDSRGNLFGTTEFGGDANHGTVFELVKGGHGAYTYSRLYSFCAADACADGALPLSGVIVDNKDHLYGTTRLGGDSNVGTVFLLARLHGVWTETVLHSFCANCTDGAGPNALTFAGAGAGRIYDSVAPLYGTTFHGGDPDAGTGSGTVFQLVRTDKVWTESVILAFCQAGCAGGANPKGKLTVDSAGTIYGTTVDGGAASGAGVVFSLAYDGTLWNETASCSIRPERYTAPPALAARRTRARSINSLSTERCGTRRCSTVSVPGKIAPMANSRRANSISTAPVRCSAQPSRAAWRTRALSSNGRTALSRVLTRSASSPRAPTESWRLERWWRIAGAISTARRIPAAPSATARCSNWRVERALNGAG